MRDKQVNNKCFSLESSSDTAELNILTLNIIITVAECIISSIIVKILLQSS